MKLKIRLTSIGRVTGGQAHVNGHILNAAGEVLPNSYVNIQGPRAALENTLETDRDYTLTIAETGEKNTGSPAA